MSLPQPPAPQITTCYRHPNREAGRRCTRCGRPACTECLVRADIGSQCVDCAKASRPDVRTRARYWNARQPTLLTYAIMAVNVAVFVWMGAANSANVGTGGRITYQQALLGLGDNLAVGTDDNRIIIVELHEQWYRLVSSGFLHYGIIHLAFNMILLFQLGQLLEPSIGRVKFGLVYLAALLGGSAGGLVLEPNGLHGGASGAVFGLLGAAAVMMLQRGINPLTTGVGSVIMLNLLITFSLRGQISVGGHIGGLLAGAAAGWFVSAPRHKGIPNWLSYAAPVIVAVAAVVLAVMVTDGSPGA
jgi:membrane associated rhomboid family serine protease